MHMWQISMAVRDLWTDNPECDAFEAWSQGLEARKIYRAHSRHLMVPNAMFH
jgi:hypothetical protein